MTKSAKQFKMEMMGGFVPARQDDEPARPHQVYPSKVPFTLRPEAVQAADAPIWLTTKPRRTDTRTDTRGLKISDLVA